MKRAKTASQAKGFTLPVVLIALSGLLLIMVATLTISTNTRKATLTEQERHHLFLGLESGQADAISLLIETTNRDSFITHQEPDSVGNPSYYLISWFHKPTKSWHHQPLISNTPSEVIPSPTDTLDTYQDHTSLPDSNDFIKMTQLGSLINNSTHFNAPRSVLFQEKNMEVSYAFWIEDLNGLLDYEALTFDNGDPSHPLESSVDETRNGLPSPPLLTSSELQARYLDKIIDQRHFGLNVFSANTISQHEYPTNYASPFKQRLTNPTKQLGAPPPPAHPFHGLIGSSPASYALTQSVLSSEISSEYNNMSNQITIGLPHTYELETVPFGHNHANAGELKTNLNHYIQQAEQANSTSALDKVVTALSQQIKQVQGFKDNKSEYKNVGISVRENSPKHSRYGGFPSDAESYTKTLAANIIDYADTNQNSTNLRSSTSGSNYRGIDSMPLFSEIVRRYSMVGHNTEEQVAFVEIRNFLEVWNPTNQTITGYLGFEHVSTQTINQNNSLSHPIIHTEIPSFTYYAKEIITLKPNEYRVVEMLYDTATGGSPDFLGDAPLTLSFHTPTSEPVIGVWISDDDGKQEQHGGKGGNKCYVLWHSTNSGAPPTQLTDFKQVDGIHSGRFNIWDGWATATPSTTHSSHNAFPIYNTRSKSLPNMTGDPRSTFYQSLGNGKNDYFKALKFPQHTSFGGPNFHNTQSPSRVNFETLSADGAYDSSHYGALLDHTSAGVDYHECIPGKYGYLYHHQPHDSKDTITPYPEFSSDHHERYLQTISNSGQFTSLGELGRIYDPAQWHNVSRRVVSQKENSNWVPKVLSDEEYNGHKKITARSKLKRTGGGITLAIGSPEFNIYDSSSDPSRKGYESARLLDQFRVTESTIRSLKSRININTAPETVLRALFSGIPSVTDKVINDGNGFVSQPRSSAHSASALPAAIAYTRSKQPYLSLSDVALTRHVIKGRELYAWGEKLSYEENSHTENEFHITNELWSDEGREELFRKTNDLFTTKSRSYRVHLIAEYKKGNRVRRKAQHFDISIQPQFRQTENHSTTFAADSSSPPKVHLSPITYK